MKRSRQFSGVLWSGLLLIVTASCHKDQSYPSTTALQTLQQTIGQDTSLSLFQQALTRTGLDTIFNGGGPYTVFAPENSAFLAAGLNANVLNGYNLQQLYNIVSHHIIPGRIGSSTIVGFTSDSVISLNKLYPPVITQNYYGLFIDGKAVTQGNIALADGILHKTAEVAFPPAGTLLQLLDSLPNTTMAAYIYHHSAALAAYASDPTSFNYGQGSDKAFNIQTSTVYSSGTIMVPSDAAFTVFGLNTIQDLAALDTLTRTNLVASCILLGSYFTSDFLGGRIIGTYPYGFTPAPGKPAIIGLDQAGVITYPDGAPVNLLYLGGSYEVGNDGLTFYGNGVLTAPMIVESNFVTTGGVLHILNQVFAPNGNYTPGHKHY